MKEQVHLQLEGIMCMFQLLLVIISNNSVCQQASEDSKTHLTKHIQKQNESTHLFKATPLLFFSDFSKKLYEYC